MIRTRPPFVVLYPSISSPPAFDGPRILRNGTFDGQTDLPDFYFECRIQYRRVTTDDGARFDVALTFDGVVDETTIKTTTSLQRNVVFTPADLRGRFGTTVSTHITAFSDMPAWSSDDEFITAVCACVMQACSNTR